MSKKNTQAVEKGDWLLSLLLTLWLPWDLNYEVKGSIELSG